MSRFDMAIVFVSAILATAFVSLWLPHDNGPLRVGVMALVLWILASPVIQWRRYWPLPFCAALSGILASAPMPRAIQYAIPAAIALGLVILYYRQWRAS
jgi:hypothetical protein